MSLSSPLRTAETPLTSLPSVAHMPTPLSDGTQLDEFEHEFLRVMEMVHAAIERNEMRTAEKDRRHAIELEWQQVGILM